MGVLEGHYSDGRKWSYISKAWILEESWNTREELARMTHAAELLKKQNNDLLTTAVRFAQWAAYTDDSLEIRQQAQTFLDRPEVKAHLKRKD